MRRETKRTQQFNGKTALVTGGGGGIGRATALAWAREGALVTISDRTRETAKETVHLIESVGGAARYIVAGTSRIRSDGVGKSQ